MSERESAPLPERGRVAGVDYGTVRIGVALGDLEVRMASPYENYTRRGEQQDAEYFRRLAREERLVRWVVGLPVHLSGEESPMSHQARRFGRWLAELTGVPVDYFDERFSSSEAEGALLDASVTKKKRKARLDKLAAHMMLTAYLESGRGGQDDPGALG